VDLSGIKAAMKQEEGARRSPDPHHRRTREASQVRRNAKHSQSLGAQLDADVIVRWGWCRRLRAAITWAARGRQGEKLA